MPLIKRNEIPALLKDEGKLAELSVVLLFGERYLCKEAADQLQEALTADGRGAVHPIDGDHEDQGQTLAKLLSFSLLPGRQVYRVSDSRIFHSKTVASTIWDKAQQNSDAGKTAPAMRHIGAFARLGSIDLESQKPFSEISGSQWEKMFGFSKPGDLGWADSLLVQAVGTGKLPKGGGNITERYIDTFTKGIPDQNVLILSAETVDKRQRFYTFIKKEGLVIDCSVATGASKAAQDAQKDVIREMMNKTLADFNKSIEPRALEIFFERVGFHPVAAVTEMEKLAHYVGDRPQIVAQDLEEMVGRSREDALFELTDAFGKRQIGRALTILNRLQENGTHGLAILATLRNYIRKLLIFRSLQLQPTPAWHSGMNAKQFQGSYLPALKEQGEWSDMLGGHPYALFMSFTKAGEFSCGQLKQWLSLLLEAEFRLKGSPIPQHIVLEEMLLTMLKLQRRG
ncbi:DNA polymerase III subunit delta [Desulfosediminicola ganghwensis]|uniref:DNA polymerase III subunit delta n=1 Tax=Desulfosediminicola ganghwensis TaxID=2569540 RepID=UPI0010AC3090|nr:DNA polymerase III subunit delta [Desulfosediminicola ganghwensis]